MRIGNLNLAGRVLCAPLAGVSSRPFRLLALRFGASAVFTEMISAEGIIRSRERTRALMRFQSDEQPIGIQLFGASPEALEKAARITVTDFAPDLIDINLGCPVRKVVSKNGGAAVLRDLELTEEIIDAVVRGAGTTPVTVKMRTGWDERNPVYIEVGDIAQRRGVAAVTLHARSRSSGFAGQADWSAIGRLKRAVGIPVIGNGDIGTPEDARRMIDETGCDAVMVGRAVMGDPLLFRHIHHFLETGERLPPVTIAERLDIAREHAHLMVADCGEARGVLKMRKFLAWYVRGCPGAAALRPRLMQVSSLADIDAVLEEYVAEIGPEAHSTA